ncbi:hypothetical protein [Paremcibacter congregatus]|uniref:anti-sigma factor family protein n=1 Tax=Paremcibacter congregatus TaxID=2043170 RepID=UPI0030ECD6D9|tara:strand:- start:412 stop:1200 length:789 start_codon:yes stop_codon:yes gene_type:complete
MTDRPLEVELHSYVDGLLDEEAMNRVEEYLLENKVVASEVQKYLVDKRNIRKFVDMETGLQPSATVKRLEDQLARKLKRKRFTQWHYAAVLAMVMTASGWVGHDVYQSIYNGPWFTDEIAVAHNLTSLEPGETRPLSTETVQGLFSRIGEPAELPDLTEFGLAPSGARLVPSYEGLVLQVTYRGAHNESLSYFLLHDNKQEELPLRILHRPNVSVAYWQHAFSRYAIVSPMSDEKVRNIADYMDLTHSQFLEKLQKKDLLKF